MRRVVQIIDGRVSLAAFVARSTEAARVETCDHEGPGAHPSETEPGGAPNDETKGPPP